MATSSTKICNLALGRIGEKRITDIDEDSPTARKCKEIYEQVRDEVMAAGPEKGWKFASGRVAVSVDAVEPDFEFEYRYLIPASPYVLRIASVQAGGVELTDWVREGDYILTNLESEEIDVKYIYRVTDESRYPPYFIRLLYLSMAVELTYTIANSSAHQERLFIELNDVALPKAIALDEQEKYVREEDTSWNEGH